MRAVFAALAAFLATFTVAVTPASALAGTEGCTTRYYFNRVQNGMSVDKVAALLSQRGHVIFDQWGLLGHMQVREYRTCSGLPVPKPKVGFRNSRVDSKTW